jgi:hypothetical protein
MRTPKTPQQKKRESYAHDRRNRYAQNDKASRRIPPVRKRKGERAHRKSVHAAMHLDSPDVDEAAVERVDRRLAVAALKLKRRWRKAPQTTLAEVVASKRPRGGAPNAKHARRIEQRERELERLLTQLEQLPQRPTASLRAAEARVAAARRALEEARARRARSTAV